MWRSRGLFNWCRCLFTIHNLEKSSGVRKCLYSSNSVAEASFSETFHGLLKSGASASCPADISSSSSSWDKVAVLRDSLMAMTCPQGHQDLTPETLAKSFCQFYNTLSEEADKKATFLLLSADFGCSRDAVMKSASELIKLQNQNRSDQSLFKCESELRKQLTPFYCDVFTEIAKLEGGTKFLVDFRADLLQTLREMKEAGGSSVQMKEMDVGLQELLRQWFMPQLLELHQVTWQSPCDLLEKVSSYEAVHPLRHWKDLKHRLGANRRCYIFLHKTLPREPLVIMHTALTGQPACSMKPLLDRKQECDSKPVTTANFYSISSTQEGLSGVSLGTTLIKMVVEELRKEFPKDLSTFVTLSPIPGFRDWLSTRLKSTGDEDADLGLSANDTSPLMQLFPEHSCNRDLLKAVLTEKDTLAPPMWNRKDTELMQVLATPLTKLCARYLVYSKRRGYALDPVANFHLRNGASVWRLNWMADTRLHRSYGLMVNYKYDLPLISHYSQTYIGSKEVKFSPSIQSYLN